MTFHRIADIRALYAEAEAAIKRYERIGLDNLIPAVNELRYAGQHILSAESVTDDAEREKHLSRAERHCERARYDAKESTIVALLEGFATIRSLGFTDAELAHVLPEWADLLATACHAQTFIAKAGNVKDASPSELDAAIFALMDAYEKLHAAEPLILGLRQKRLAAVDAERQAEEDRRVKAQEEAQLADRIEEDRRYVRSILLSWLGLVVGVLGLAASVFGIDTVPLNSYIKTWTRDKNLAYEGVEDVNGYKWSYRVWNGKAEIVSKRGAQSQCAVSPKPTGALVVPSKFDGVMVTIVRPDAFCGCSEMTSVTIPSSLTQIDSGTFKRCDGLLSFSVDPNNPKYSSVNGLLCSKDGTTLIAGVNGDVKIPQGVTNISGVTFSNCRKIKSFSVDAANPSFSVRDGQLCSKDGVLLIKAAEGNETIPSCVEKIGTGAFSGLTGLESITIPENVRVIESWAFYDCNGLKTVALPRTVTNLYERCPFHAFATCSDLMSYSVDADNPSYSSRNGLLCSKDGTVLIAGVNGDVVIPVGVKTIKDRAFLGCGALKTVKIPQGVTSVGGLAFSGCRSLSSVEIPEGVKSIGSSAFDNCRALKSVTIPSSVTSIGMGAFWRTPYYDNQTDGVIVLENGLLYDYKGKCSPYVAIPSNVTCIGTHAFFHKEVKMITIPSSVKSIESGAFFACYKLVHLTIPATVTNVACDAFECRHLKSVDIVKDGEVETVTFEAFSKRWHLNTKTDRHIFSMRRPNVNFAR